MFEKHSHPHLPRNIVLVWLEGFQDFTNPHIGSWPYWLGRRRSLFSARLGRELLSKA